MIREFWVYKRDLITGVFTIVFVGVFAAALALWLVAAVIVGTAHLIGMVE